MVKLNCTSCGAEVPFRSKASVFAVCSFCKSTLVRQDMNLELLGKMADLQYEVTPFQVGTSGTYNHNAFTIIGRLKVSYRNGFWNEWYVIFNDGDTGWLAEAQGFLAMCFPRQDVPIPDSSTLQIGDPCDLKGVGRFFVDDGRDVICVYSEGELPMNAMKGRESYSVDLSGDDGEFATIEYAKGEDRLFIGRYADFDDFQFKDLRRIDGWN